MSFTNSYLIELSIAFLIGIGLGVSIWFYLSRRAITHAKSEAKRILEEAGIEKDAIEEALTSLMDKGLIYEPVLGTIKTT